MWKLREDVTGQELVEKYGFEPSVLWRNYYEKGIVTVRVDYSRQYQIEWYHKPSEEYKEALELMMRMARDGVIVEEEE